MSTRSTTHFVHGDRTAAIVYRHADGYPDGHGVDLQRFFADVEAQTSDTRFGDPAYLASKLVVWLAREFSTALTREEHGDPGDEDYRVEYVAVSHFDTRPLDFLSVGVVMEDPSDIEYLYVIDTSIFDAKTRRPLVTCYEVDHADGWDGPVVRGKVVPIPTGVDVEVAA